MSFSHALSHEVNIARILHAERPGHASLPDAGMAIGTPPQRRSTGSATDRLAPLQ